MNEPANTVGVTKWVYAVIALVAIIGLLAGLLISQATTPAPISTTAQFQTDTPPENGNNPPPKNPDGADQDVRRIVRNLTPARRLEVLHQAMKNVEKTGYERPRDMFKKRQQARRKTLEIARSEPFDPDAMRSALEDVHKVNLEMAKHGTDLTIEVLQLMTPEERKAATQGRAKTRRDRNRQRREKRQERRQQD